MVELAKIRCRRPQCNNFETDVPFPKCGKCKLARYCSRECQLADWPLHKLMCSADRVVLHEDGTTDLATDFMSNTTTEPKSSTDGSAADGASPKPSLPSVSSYQSPEELNDEDFLKSTIERLQLQTNLFVVDQYRQTNQQRGFLMIQTEASLDDFRYTDGMKLGMKLDRSFICYYLSYKEFVKEVLPNHPNPNLKRFKDKLFSSISSYNPEAEVVTLAIFGCGYTGLLKSDYPSYKDIVEMLNREPNMFGGEDCVEIYIDRD